MVIKIIEIVGPSSRASQRLANELTRAMRYSAIQASDDEYPSFRVQAGPLEPANSCPSLKVYLSRGYPTPISHTCDLLCPSNHRMTNGTMCSILQRFDSWNGNWTRAPIICLTSEFGEMSRDEVIELATIIREVLNDKSIVIPELGQVHSCIPKLNS